tara:strand:- start:333 stop:530 length:198 start_codon:yes stop_codon:yes gene_type:complete
LARPSGNWPTFKNTLVTKDNLKDAFDDKLKPIIDNQREIKNILYGTVVMLFYVAVKVKGDKKTGA